MMSDVVKNLFIPTLGKCNNSLADVDLSNSLVQSLMTLNIQQS